MGGLLPGALTALGERLPHVRVDLVEAEPPDLFTALDGGQVDVAVAATPPYADRRYHRGDLCTDVLDVAVPAVHRLADRERIALREPALEPWIVGDARSCCGAVARSVCAAAGFTPDIRHAVNDWGAPAALVEAGQGVALIPRLAQPLYAHRRIARLTTTGTPPSRNIFAAVRTGSEGDPVLAAVREQLAAVAKESTRPAAGTWPSALPTAPGTPATPPP